MSRGFSVSRKAVIIQKLYFRNTAHYLVNVTEVCTTYQNRQKKRNVQLRVGLFVNRVHIACDYIVYTFLQLLLRELLLQNITKLIQIVLFQKMRNSLVTEISESVVISDKLSSHTDIR